MFEDAAQSTLQPMCAIYSGIDERTVEDGSVSESSDSDATDDGESDVEDLLGSADSDKQIEMDL